jgi:membrane fusion protein, multidrug efflux system
MTAGAAKTWRVNAAGYAITALLALTLAACGKSDGAKGPMGPPEVGVVVISPGSYAPTVDLPGRVTAYETSEVRPQIGGIVLSRNFREGAPVRAGQTLYVIDPSQANAAVANAQAAAASAQALYQRYQRLIDIHAISQQDFDNAQSASNQANANLRTARISLAYTRVTAPISGIIGASSVTSGALATPAQPTAFAVIQQIDRVYVDMSRSAAEVLQLRGGGTAPASRADVRLTLPDGSAYPTAGDLQFSDISVDPTTGTVTLRALFANPNHVLLPGMFVQTTVTQPTQHNVILAPQQGISRDARGQATALVLSAQGVVTQRSLQTGATAGDKWVVLSGLAAGDLLIVDGIQRVHPGDHARGVPAQLPAAPNAPAPSGGDSTTIRGREG